MITLKDLLGGSGAILGPTLATNFFESRTWTAPQDGIVIVRGMGAGGGGALHGTSATGGYSGSWGCKIVRVKKGDTISVAIGAGGIGASSLGNGTAGGDTIITINGVQYIAYGGPGGVAGAAGPLPDGPSPSANWDFGAASVKPGWAASGSTGGAGVDILAQGNNATTSASIYYSAGGGTGGPSAGSGSGSNGGGAMPGGKSALGSSPSNPAITFDASQGEWGISFYGGSGAIGTGTVDGGNGGGGNGNGGKGGNGGGGGGLGGKGGIGGGGGGNEGGSGGSGGQGFAHLKFFADMGV